MVAMTVTVLWWKLHILLRVHLKSNIFIILKQMNTFWFFR